MHTYTTESIEIVFKLTTLTESCVINHDLYNFFVILLESHFLNHDLVILFIYLLIEICVINYDFHFFFYLIYVKSCIIFHLS